METKQFRDRRAAGQALGRRLKALGYSERAGVIVLGLPRGGVPVAYEVASLLRAPLDVFMVRKLGTPGQEELALGAIASGGVRIINKDVVGSFGIPQTTIDEIAVREQAELERREVAFRGSRPPLKLAKQTVILIDDGLATGATMRAAVAAVQESRPARIVIAVPVAAEDTCRDLAKLVDEMVCLMTPMFFHAVGQWYEEFSQTDDDEVRELLQRAAAPPSSLGGIDRPSAPGTPA